MSRDQNAGQSRNIKIGNILILVLDNNFFESVEHFK